MDLQCRITIRGVASAAGGDWSTAEQGVAPLYVNAGADAAGREPARLDLFGLGRLSARTPYYARRGSALTVLERETQEMGLVWGVEAVR